MTNPNLTGVPETMLWTLHNRASEASRPDGVVKDDKCLEIYQALDYDYERSFGKAEPSHGVRSAVFDEHVRNFIEAHPNAVIVNLGEGLETQRYRITDDAGVLWVSVDVAEAIEIRERFMSPDARHVHVSCSALDEAWFDTVPEGRPVFVTAQGLFMYFTEDDVRELLKKVAHRFSGVQIMFDYVPRWLTSRTTSEKGLYKTPHYRVPPLPWGVHRSEAVFLLKEWLGNLTVVYQQHYTFPRGWQRLVFGTVTLLPWVRERSPGMICVRTKGGAR